MLAMGGQRRAVSPAVLTSVVIALVILAGAGFGLYLTKPTVTSTTTEVMTHTEVMTETTPKPAIPFLPAPNVMMAEGIHNAYLIIAPVGSGHWSVEIHGEGLESTGGTNNIYIVEAQQKSGTMASMPMVAQNTTASEFGVGIDGIGQYFIILNLDPTVNFKSVQLVFLGGMEMSNATAIATATL